MSRQKLMDEEMTAEAVKRLAAERPDLVPHLRRCVELGGSGYFEDIPQEALDEFVRRGLLTREQRLK